MSTPPNTKRPPGVYLDHAAGTPLWLAVRRALAKEFAAQGNPGSAHQFGRARRAQLDAALTKLARLLEVKRDEIILTSGATESANLAISGAILAYRRRHGRLPHVITSPLDHPAVLAPLEALGVETTYLPVSKEGLVRAESVRSALQPTTGLVAITAASNELGSIQPIRQIAQILASAYPDHSKRPLLYTDAAQLAAWQPITASRLEADLLTLSGAKLGAPAGTGILYIRRGSPVLPLFFGGNQQRGFRPGTEDVAGAVAMSTALATTWEGLPRITPKITRLRDTLATALAAEFPTMRFHHSANQGLPNFLVLSIPGLDAELAAATLDAAGVAVSTGSACSAASDPSYGRALRSIGAEDAVGSSLRITLGHTTSDADIAAALPRMITAIHTSRTQSGVSRQLAETGQVIAQRYAA